MSENTPIISSWPCTLSAVCLAVALALTGPVIAFAQQSTGNIYGTVVDESGNSLDGVEITLAGPGAVKIRRSGNAGQFRFLKLDPGGYVLTGKTEGYAPVVSEDLEVRVGRNLTVELQLSQAMEEMIVVAARAPLLDIRKIEQGATLTEIQLKAIPTARDPWAFLHHAPGVLTDRVNVGGNESGQNSIFVAPGAGLQDNNYSLDGVQITDMGSVDDPMYYDFETFEEVRVTTGGADVSLVAPGVTVNLVTKRGTSTPSGSVRLFFTNDSLQSSPDVPDSSFGPGQDRIETNQIRSVNESGAGVGGPLIRDKVWARVAWSKTDVRQNTAGGSPFDTFQENMSVRFDAQPTARDILVGWYTSSEYPKTGRGAGPGRAPETTTNESGDGTDVWKIEASRLLTPSLFVSGFYSELHENLNWVPLAGSGPEAPEAILGPDGVFRDGFLDLIYDNRDEQYQIEGSWFTSTGSLRHEIKAGVRSREYEGLAFASWPGGRDLVNIAGVNFGLPDGPQDVFFLQRVGSSGTVSYRSAWLQDTINGVRWTLNLGLRYDRQDGANAPLAFPANPIRPDIFPAIDFPGDRAGGFVWKEFQPRLGVTWSLDDQTLLRGSYSRFVQQLHGEIVTPTHPLAWPGPVAYFLFIDEDDDNRFDEGEFSQFLFGENYNVADPTRSPNINDPNLEAVRTDEFLLGFEKSLTPDFAFGANLVHRRIDRLHEKRLLVRDLAGGTERAATADDYQPDTTITGMLPDGKPYSIPTWSLKEGLVSTGGVFLTNGDREQEYLGGTLFFTRRLSDRWMLQGHLNWSDFTWKIGPEYLAHSDPNDEKGSGDNDGDVVAVPNFDRGLDNKTNVYYNSRWTFSLAGMVEIAPDRPWGFDLSGNITGRDGYPLPYYVSILGSDGIGREIQVTDNVDSFRNEDLVTFDLGASKDVKVRDGLVATFHLTVFNVFNEGTVLQRELQLNSPRGDHLDEALSPRIVRVGVSLHWN